MSCAYPSDSHPMHQVVDDCDPRYWYNNNYPPNPHPHQQQPQNYASTSSGEWCQPIKQEDFNPAQNPQQSYPPTYYPEIMPLDSESHSTPLWENNRPQFVDSEFTVKHYSESHSAPLWEKDQLQPVDSECHSAPLWKTDQLVNSESNSTHLWENSQPPPEEQAINEFQPHQKSPKTTALIKRRRRLRRTGENNSSKKQRLPRRRQHEAAGWSSNSLETVGF